MISISSKNVIKTNAKSIVKGILVIGVIYLAILLLTTLSELYLVSGILGIIPRSTFNYTMYLINIWTEPILGIFLLKLVCEALYKILRLAEIMINKNVKSSDEKH